MTTPDVRARGLAAPLAGWLPEQRWFAGKHRTVRTVTPVSCVALVETEPLLDHVVVEVAYAAGAPDRYQLLLGYRRQLPEKLQHVRIGAVDDLVAYAGLWDDVLAEELLRLLDSGAVRGGLRFRPEAGAAIPRGEPSRVVDVEQSNTSVVYDESAILKLFRRLTPGRNPDVELNRALRRAGSEHVAELLGEVEGELLGDTVSYAMVSAYAANSAEGWAMATASVRDLFAEGDLRADEVGGDFAGEAERLGEAIAAVHADLADTLGSTELDRAGYAELSTGMIGRLSDAVGVVPELAPHADALRTEFAAVAGLTDACPVQRIHGDLHLGQVLRTPTSWLVIDFEGEPVKPLAERLLPDSPLRDVAGMLRSFDYAAEHLLVGDTADDHQLEFRAQEWAARNRKAFCTGYAGAARVDPMRHAALLRAYELDKAVYEVVYEATHRPAWRSIPLRSIARMVAAGS
ncbi:maltokinase N-terminal cap-like domain-containing protein [Actinocatenispora rupis]|uniref:Maltokinase n=1 Tax=Actinocatenispora rupis TaxID=519421 RepID=A0A8J3J5G3_9ACTN|nr:phosphotransferase [Actinocatenispora rupis]GID14483.1 maltokinase [Actinocatenispora rupis]